MNFKNWIFENWDDWANDDWDSEEDWEAKVSQRAEKVFGQRKTNSMLDFRTILKHLGLPDTRRSPKQIGVGSMATVYVNPHNPKTVIKVTSDVADITNIQKAQKLQSPNIVKMHQFKIVSPQMAVAVLDYVKGKQVPISIDGIMRLVQGDHNEGYADAVTGIFNTEDQTRNSVLNAYKINNHKTRMKWSELFKTLANLERMKIALDDLSENLIDNGQSLVLIDLGLKL